MKQTILSRHDDVGVDKYDSIEWAFEVHVKQPDTRMYNYAVLFGNEDAPERIDFYRHEPEVTDVPNWTWKPEGRPE